MQPVTKVARSCSALGCVVTAAGFTYSLERFAHARATVRLFFELKPLEQDGPNASTFYSAIVAMAEASRFEAVAQACFWALAFTLFAAALVALHRSNPALQPTDAPSARRG